MDALHKAGYQISGDIDDINWDAIAKILDIGKTFGFDPSELLAETIGLLKERG
jgi:hypothetical protein